MEIIHNLIDFIIHIDKHLLDIVQHYQTWTYLILFLIIFCETGLVVTPFLPGDSLLFAAGALAAQPNSGLSLLQLLIVLIIAAFAGDTLNYHIGKFIGPKVFEKNYRLLKKSYLEKTQNFFELHGGKTIIFARFIPIIRTFAPFIAGVGTMSYSKFISFNIVGGVLWVSGFLIVGYFFGNLPAVKENFTFVIFGIILISVLPVLIGLVKGRLKKS